MRPIPEKLKKQIAQDPNMKFCIYESPLCRGKVEWEHAFIYAGKQINEWWAIIGVCVYHHRGAGLNKEFNQFKALDRAVKMGHLPFIMDIYPKIDWLQKYKYLVSKFEKND